MPAQHIGMASKQIPAISGWQSSTADELHALLGSYFGSCESDSACWLATKTVLQNQQTSSAQVSEGVISTGDKRKQTCLTEVCA